MKQPIMIMGMHRSGTSMLTRILEKSGIFVGNDLSQYHESYFFYQLNNLLLNQLGGRWDNPPDFNYLLNNEPELKINLEYFDDILNSVMFRKYLGLKSYVKSGGYNNFDFNWGWKDPQNTITLPFWLKIFPEAKLVYIERHGVDVAKSLKKRNDDTLERGIAKYQKYKKLYPFRPKTGGFSFSLRCGTLQGGLDLWNEYRAAAKINLALQNKELVHSIKYEDLLTDPQEHLTNLFQFLQLNIDQKTLDKLSANINASRCYAYRKNEELSRFAEENKTSLLPYEA
ncbi:MAG: sulfotransferase [Gracilimonas sp.]|nr:sulfotransferase [Gracilimonas sp.]